MNLLSISVRVALPVACLIACGGPEEPRTPDTPPVTKSQAQPPSVQAQQDSSPPPQVVTIDENIRRACGLSQSEAYFAYNSSAVQGDANDLLQKIVTCFTTGPLADRSLALVGHADPRGDEEYNYALGGRRASQVEDHLVRLGFPESRIGASSRGESEARGVDEQGWRTDRRVEMLLGS